MKKLLMTLIIVLVAITTFTGCKEAPITKNELLQMISSGEDVTNVNTSKITDMSNMFYKANSFNQDISGWDVSNVTNMHWMFHRAYNFNQDISGWDVSNVTEMYAMFAYAQAFNQDISEWADHISEDVSHDAFSAGGCPLTADNHPYESWD